MGRWTVVAILALVALAFAPALPHAAAQTTGGPGGSVVLDDPAGDVKTQLGGVPAGGGEAAYPAVDLRGLSVQETPFSVAFTLTPAALPKDTDPGADGVYYAVMFAHNGREFMLRLQFALRAIVPTDNAYADLLFRDDPQADWSVIWSSPNDAVVDTGAGTVSIDVARDLFADKDGAAPFPGRALEGLHVRSQSLFSDSDAVIFDVPAKTPQSVTDAMPNAEPYPSLPVLLGLAQTGHARLTSLTPFRASNGEATTFVYNVTATNIGDAPDTFELAATSVPAGYTAVLPVPAVALDGRTSQTVPVLLTMPFGHQHGALASLVLELKSASDTGSVGRLEIGVRFLAVPQPAGHHDTVYLHTGPATGGIAGLGGVFPAPPGYINTFEQDPTDQAAKDCAVSFSAEGTGNWHVSWPYRLQPALLMGIDVDAAKVGHFKVPISTTFPALQAQMGSNLYLEPPRTEDGDRPDMVHLAGMALTAPVDLAGGGATMVVEGDFVPDAEAPRVAFQEGSNLVLWMTLLFKGPNSPGLAGEGACVLPGGSVSLPLREWHDAVDQVLASLDGPGLSPLGPQERLVNPGEAVLFPVSIANPLDQGKRFRLEVTGPNSGWAVLSDESVEVPAHGTAQATVLVRAPAAAVDGERADLVLQAFPGDHPTSRGLLRMVAVVDSDADQVDDSAAAPVAAKKSPGPGAIGPTLALAALAMLARRRRL
jgi:hypothetical protein